MPARRWRRRIEPDGTRAAGGVAAPRLDPHAADLRRPRRRHRWRAGSSANIHPAAAPFFRPFSQLFLRLIKMIIAPLIFATLVAGIAGAGHFKVVGRMGLRAIIYFEVVTTLALVIGLVAVNVMRPGRRREPADGPAVRDHGDARRPGTRSSCTSSPSRSSRRWPTATSCRSSSSASSSRSPSA